ncbi:hypothetical protein MHA02_05920 [Methylobacterium haplocladii]|uniref:OmpA-like domain-containing protein n=1 Tax=Methylobacterium haplocladii TaxID=1176176 RepID=A0A512IKI8_9HYPH|nr:hypothetical protein MHA02_05920 [Methylobacterium haplocladii]
MLALLWAGTTGVTAPIVADALRAESTPIVRDTGLGEPEPWLRIEAEGRDLLALGEAPDSAARDATLTRLSAIPGLRRLSDRTGLIGSASPFVWTATRVSADRIEIGGNRPAEIGAAALAARLSPALPPDATLRDRARAARGGPAGFALAAAYLVERLGGFAPGAVATLSDTTLSINGEALDSAAYEAARSTPPEGFALGSLAVLPPRVDDFRFVVERRPDGGLTLGGNIVSEAARAETLKLAGIVVANAATGAGEPATVADALRTARGLDDTVDPAALAGAALRLAGLIREGTVRFERGSLSVSGTALDEEAVGEAEAALRDGRPAGVSAGSVSLGVRPVSPYAIRIRRESGTVTVTGYLPDRAAREALNAALRPRFLREAIVDRSRISSGAPPQLVAALTATIGPLSALASGEVSTTDRTMQLSGESLYAESARRAGEDLRRAMPPAWESTVSITTRDAAPAYDTPTCARLFSEKLAGHTLRFAPGSSELRPNFYPVLDALADLAKACRAERVEVTGHLDPPGAPVPKPAILPEAKAEKDKADKAKADKAQKPGKAADKKPGSAPTEKTPAETEAAPDLATARAAAIVDYLLKAGVASDRALAAPGSAPLSDRQGIGLALRS